jgi:hypothetical protein
VTVSKVVAGVLLVVAIAAIVLHRTRAPRAFVTAGRSPLIDTHTVSVTRVAVAPATVNYDGKEVQAGPGHKYVLLDCRIAAAATSVQFDDFQLVRDSVAEIGHETNVGDHGERDSFYWTFLDETGGPLMQAPDEAGPFMARLAFKVPTDAHRGYLFTWGLYWGPLDF